MEEWDQEILDLTNKFIEKSSQYDKLFNENSSMWANVQKYEKAFTEG